MIVMTFIMMMLTFVTMMVLTFVTMMVLTFLMMMVLTFIMMMVLTSLMMMVLTFVTMMVSASLTIVPYLWRLLCEGARVDVVDVVGDGFLVGGLEGGQLAGQLLAVVVDRGAGEGGHAAVPGQVGVHLHLQGVAVQCTLYRCTADMENVIFFTPSKF